MPSFWLERSHPAGCLKIGGPKWCQDPLGFASKQPNQGAEPQRKIRPARSSGDFLLNLQRCNRGLHVSCIDPQTPRLLSRVHATYATFLSKTGQLVRRCQISLAPFGCFRQMLLYAIVPLFLTSAPDRQNVLHRGWVYEYIDLPTN